MLSCEETRNGSLQKSVSVSWNHHFLLLLSSLPSPRFVPTLNCVTFQSTSFVKRLIPVDRGWHQVALKPYWHNGSPSPTMHSLPCETEQRVHYINMPSAVQVSLQHQWVPTRLLSTSLCD